MRGGYRQSPEGKSRQRAEGHTCQQLDPEARVLVSEHGRVAVAVRWPNHGKEDQQSNGMNDDPRKYRAGEERKKSKHHVRCEVPEQCWQRETLSQAVAGAITKATMITAAVCFGSVGFSAGA